MASTERDRVPNLQPPKPEIADRGNVRLGDGIISDGFPTLRMPKRDIADRGAVRLGDGIISDGFPVRS